LTVLSESVRILAYTGQGSHYLLLIRGRAVSTAEAKLPISDNPNIVAALLITKGDRITVTEETFDLLSRQGHIGRGKLEAITDFRQGPQIV